MIGAALLLAFVVGIIIGYAMRDPDDNWPTYYR